MSERTHKRCTRCEGWIPLDEFRLRPKAAPHGHSLGYDSWCRSCHAEATRDWRARNPEHEAEYNLKRRAEYRQTHPLREQKCPVCGQSFTKRTNKVVCSERCRYIRKRERRKSAA
jgi:hypothetical protein